MFVSGPKIFKQQQQDLTAGLAVATQRKLFQLSVGKCMALYTKYTVGKRPCIRRIVSSEVTGIFLLTPTAFFSHKIGRSCRNLFRQKGRELSRYIE
jgi:hypothetical protein